MAFCTYCGNKLDDNAKFCTGCGAKLEAAPVQPAAPAQEPAVQQSAPAQGSYTPTRQSYTPPVQQPAQAAASSGSYTPPQQGTYTPTQQSYTPPVQQQPTQAAANSGSYSYGSGAPVYEAGAKKGKSFKKPSMPSMPAGPAGKKRLITIGGIALAVILLIVLISSCGGGGGGAAADDPNLGVYNAVTAEMWGMEMPITDLFTEGVSVELKEKGKCVLNLDGTTGKGKWSLEDGVFSAEAGGAELNGTLSNGVLVAENVLDMGVNITFEKEGGFVAPAPAEGEASVGTGGEVQSGGGVSALQKQWNGTWYGAMYVYEAEGDFAGIPSDVYDCYMIVDVDEEGMGSYEVYLAGVDEAFAAAECEAKEHGIDTVSGSIAGMVEMNTHNWMFRPVPDFPDRYTATDSIEYDDSLFEFSLFFKQWGKSWQDEIDTDFEIVPPSVQEYEAAIMDGQEPPVGFAPIEYAGRVPAEDDVAAGAGMEVAPAGDYGKTVPDADGVVDFDTLKAGFDWLRHETSYENGYGRPTYEEIMEQMGVHAAKTHEDSWEDDYHVYEWVTSDGEFLLLSFKVDENGNETWNSSSWSGGLND